MSGLLAAEGVATLTNLLEHVAVANFGFDHFDTGLLHRNTKTKVAHHGCNQCVACQIAAVFGSQRQNCHDLIAIDNCAGVINSKGSIGIAVVGDSHISLVF